MAHTIKSIEFPDNYVVVFAVVVVVIVVIVYLTRKKILFSDSWLPKIEDRILFSHFNLWF